MAVENNVNEKRYQIPCLIDGRYFSTIAEAWQFLMEVNGRVHIDRLERHIRQGRRVLEGHVIGGVKEGGRVDTLSLRN
jgi:hypothetical protein